MILGTDLDPDLVTTRLNLEPDQSWRRGARKFIKRQDGSKRYFRSKHEWGGWKKFISEELKNKELPEQITYWIKTLQASSEGMRQLHEAGCHIALSCFVTPHGEDGGTASIIITPTLMEAAAELGLDLEVSFQS